VTLIGRVACHGNNITLLLLQLPAVIPRQSIEKIIIILILYLCDVYTVVQSSRDEQRLPRVTIINNITID